MDSAAQETCSFPTPNHVRGRFLPLKAQREVSHLWWVERQKRCASSLSSSACMLSGPMNLWLSNLSKLSLTWFFSTKENCSFLQTFPLASRVWGSFVLVLAIKLKQRRCSVTPPSLHPPQFSLDFLLLMMDLKPFLMSWTALARFSSK